MFKKGFTLIELLVVIALIGVLAVIVLAMLSSARTKGADAVAKSNIVGVRSQAELVYARDGHYDAVCGANTTPQEGVISTQINETIEVTDSEVVCGASSDGNNQDWAITAVYKSDSGRGWCVDSSGTSKEIDVSLFDKNMVACP